VKGNVLSEYSGLAEEVRAAMGVDPATVDPGVNFPARQLDVAEAVGEENVLFPR
jgi:hypothetical protein